MKKNSLRALLLFVCCATLHAEDFYLIGNSFIVKQNTAALGKIQERVDGSYGKITAWATLSTGDIAIGNADGEVYVIDKNDLSNVLEKGRFGAGQPITALGGQANGNLVVSSASFEGGCLWIVKALVSGNLSEIVAKESNLPVRKIVVRPDDSLVLLGESMNALHTRGPTLDPRYPGKAFIHLGAKPIAFDLGLQSDGDIIVSGGVDESGYLWRLSSQLKSLEFQNLDKVGPLTKVVVNDSDEIIVCARSKGYLYLRSPDVMSHKAFLEIAKGLVALKMVDKHLIAVCAIGVGPSTGYLYSINPDTLISQGFHSGVGASLIGLLK